MVRHANRYSSTEVTSLTFEEICPAWSDKLKKDLSNDTQNTMYISHSNVL